MDATELPLATRGMLFVLTRWMNRDGGNCYPGRRRIAAFCGISERQVDRHVARAVMAGYLHIVADGHRGQNPVYAACVPACRWDMDAQRIVPSGVVVPPRQRKLRPDADLPRAPKAGRVEAESGTSRRESGTWTPAEWDEDGAPTSYMTSVNPPASDGFASGAADASPRMNIDPNDYYEWISDQVDGMDIDEEDLALAMLSNGAHRNAVVNAIRKRRREDADAL
ncbi:MAG TPA: helix-turn-helix domain-containing protein [Nocardioidaceae bacterium]|nr:helix-turn-helix domain-containing protein [Nocardioidaceae bacterium]